MFLEQQKPNKGTAKIRDTQIYFAVLCKKRVDEPLTGIVKTALSTVYLP